MRHGTYPGASMMDAICRAAPGDIRHRLWTLYWLARMQCSRPESTGIVVELGTRLGDSTRAFLAASLDLRDVVMIYSYDIENVKDAVMRRTQELGLQLLLSGAWVFGHMDSVKAGRHWTEKSTPADLVFVDTDHLFETTRQEIAVWSPHVRVGGCMVFHDYWLHDPGRPEAGHGVKRAVDEFVDAHRDAWALESHDSVADGDTGLAILWRLA